MRQTMSALTPALALLLLAGCGDAVDDTVPPVPADAPMPVEPDGGIGDGAGPPPVALDDPNSGIPAAMQGRWGLVSADCEPGRADAKGLMEVTATSVTFYESRGELAEIQRQSPDSIRARFDFTGEGMEWESDIRFALNDSGTRLTRNDLGAQALPDPQIYTKCD